jgi:hypothetical protein
MELSEYAKKIRCGRHDCMEVLQEEQVQRLADAHRHGTVVMVREDEQPAEGKIAVYCRGCCSETKPIWTRKRRG